MIDQKHLDTVFELDRLHVLINSIPELSKWQGHISMLFREKAAKLQLPPKPTRVHPLACSGKKRDHHNGAQGCTFRFFFGQMGQHDKEHNRRLTIAGGDELTFQKCLSFNATSSFIRTIFKGSGLLNLHSHSGIPSGLTSVVYMKLTGIHCSARTLRHLDIVLQKLTDPSSLKKMYIIQLRK